MSENKISFRNKNQMIVQTDLTKTFVFNNDFYSDNGAFWFENSFNDGVLIPEGTLLGRKTSTGNLQVFNAEATDGTQIPVGILVEGVWVDYGEVYDATVAYCIRGDVAEQKIVLQGSDTLETIVGTVGRRVKDLITAIGIKIVYSQQNLIQDNT